jgi:hypothetical protein
MNERCVLCGDNAAVRVRGTSFCAACGLNQYSADATAPVPRRRSRRAAFLAVMTSGLFIKGLLGAVALAAVGGAAATTVFGHDSPDNVQVATTVVQEVQTTSAPAADASASAVVDATATTEAPDVQTVDFDDPVFAYVAAVQAWSDCVAEAAASHGGGPFDPNEACPNEPSPDDFGLVDNGPGNSEDAPGHDVSGPGNSEDAPGHDVSGPGNSEDAPGHDVSGPGNSEDAPGHDVSGPGNSEDAPGNSTGLDTKA